MKQKRSACAHHKSACCLVGCMLQYYYMPPSLLSWMAVKMAHWPRVNRSSNRRQKSTRHMATSANNKQQYDLRCSPNLHLVAPHLRQNLRLTVHRLGRDEHITANSTRHGTVIKAKWISMHCNSLFAYKNSFLLSKRESRRRDWLHAVKTNKHLL